MTFDPDATTARPKSDIPIATGLVGLIGFLVSIPLLRMAEITGTVGPLIMLLATAVPMVMWDVLVGRVHRNATAGFDFTSPRAWRHIRQIVVVKMIGLLATFALIGGLYFALGTFSEARFDYFYLVLNIFGLGLLALSPPYLLLTSRYMRDPKDSLWQFGCLVVGKRREVERGKVSNYLLSWAVKGFFLSFMFSIILPSYQSIILFDFSELAENPKVLVFFAVPFLFLIDVCFGTVGYIFSLKILDSHIRTANPYLAGWVAALICYPPFALMARDGLLDYRQNTGDWWMWFEGYPIVIALWGGALVVLTLIYAWATVVFGLRFSNLTNRGIITAGPYSMFKHPAYLSKCLYWWMLYVPILSVAGPSEAIRNTILLALVSAIYYWRAKTEEQHLMEEPKYRDYSAWIKENGVIPRINAVLFK